MAQSSVNGSTIILTIMKSKMGYSIHFLNLETMRLVLKSLLIV